MASEKKVDLDEPVNVDMEPEDALRLLLGDEPAEDAEANDDDADDSEGK